MHTMVNLSLFVMICIGMYLMSFMNSLIVLIVSDCVDVIVWVMHVDSHMLGSLVASKSLTGLDGVPSH